MVPSHRRQAHPALNPDATKANPLAGPALSFRYIDGLY
jgi:hypothetical protein